MKLDKSIFGIFHFLISLLLVVALSSPALAGSVVCRVETDRSILPAGGAQEVVIKVSLDAPPAPANIQRPRVNLALVIDQSGSMHGTKIKMAKKAALEALSRLSSQDQFSLVVYDTQVTTLIPARTVGNPNQLIHLIQNIQAGGNTALFGGVSQGAAELRKNIEADYVHRLVLLSDGVANVGPSSADDLGRLGRGLFKEKISVTTVGVGTDYNEDLMARLSQNSDGNTYFVESGVDLPRIFAAELGEVLNVVATDVDLEVTLPPGVEPIDIIGREGRIKDNRVTLSMNQLYGGQEKYALIRLKLPKTQDNEIRELATAKVAYMDPYARTRQTSQGQVKTRFSDHQQTVFDSTNMKVLRAIQLNLNAQAQERAIEFMDDGQTAKAVETLEKSAKALKQMGTTYNDPSLMQEAQSTAVKAKALENKRMYKKNRKMLRTESYQIQNQQQVK